MLEKRQFKSSPYIFFLIVAITAKRIKVSRSLSGCKNTPDILYIFPSLGHICPWDSFFSPSFSKAGTYKQTNSYAWSNYEHFFAVHLVRVAPFVFISVTTQQSILFTLRHRGTNLGLPQHNGSCRAFTDGLFCSDSTFFISAQKQKKNNNKSPNVTIFPLSSLWLHVRHWGDKHSGTCCCCVKDTLYRLIPLTCA